MLGFGGGFCASLTPMLVIGPTMAVRVIWIWLACLSACLSPDSTVCGGGGGCPPGLSCVALEDRDVCLLPSCGDGTVDLGEVCDDGNHLDGDGCRFDCLDPCGDGVLDPDEACDDGNQLDGDGCNADCTSSETCGN